MSGSLKVCLITFPDEYGGEMKLRKGALMVVPLVVASVLVGCGAATSGPKGEPALPTSIAPVTQAKSLQVPLLSLIHI